MSGSKLHDFQERVADVPPFLRRHLALIRDLDEKVVTLQSEIEVQSRLQDEQEQHSSKAPRRQQHGRGPGANGADGVPAYDIDSAVTRLLSLADEKVTIAAQIYDFVDKHIQHLDGDLKALGKEIEDGRRQRGLGHGETGCSRAGVDLRKTTRRGGDKASEAATERASGGGASGRRKGRRQPVEEPEEKTTLQIAHPPSEHEPLYCFCQRPSHGHMIACDNDDCEHEWFHYECVGLTEPPSALEEWLCPQCVRLQRS